VRSRLAALQPKPEVGWFYGSLQEAWLEASTHSSVRTGESAENRSMQKYAGSLGAGEVNQDCAALGLSEIEMSNNCPSNGAVSREAVPTAQPGCAANDDKQGPGDGKVNNRDRLPHRAATHSVPLQLVLPASLARSLQQQPPIQSASTAQSRLLQQAAVVGKVRPPPGLSAAQVSNTLEAHKCASAQPPFSLDIGGLQLLPRWRSCRRRLGF
jgi:hypothetical protein